MQQTETYKLNLIETSDVFSPEPLNQNTRAVEAQLSAVRGEFAAADAGLSGQVAALEAAKADQTALDAGLSALVALTGRVGTLEDGKLLWTTGTYIGNGKYGKENPSRLEFDFTPLVLVISKDTTAGSYPWIRGAPFGRTEEAGSALITWEERAVSWYSSHGTDRQLNVNKSSYYYFVLGIAG